METILGIDTSSSELSVALIKGGRPETVFSRYARNSHSDLISKGVDFVLESSGLFPEDVDAFAVSSGPGSFTGLRIGISFVKGFLFLKQKPVMEISSLEVLGGSVPVYSGSVAVGIDARKGFLYSALFKKKGNVLTRITEDRFLHFSDFKKELDSDTYVVIDNMGYKPGFPMEELRDSYYLLTPDDILIPRALTCALTAWSMRESPELWTEASVIEPRYMQRSYAERKE